MLYNAFPCAGKPQELFLLDRYPHLIHGSLSSSHVHPSPPRGDAPEATRVYRPVKMCLGLYNRSGCRDIHNCQRWESNWGPLTPQSGMYWLKGKRLPILVTERWARSWSRCTGSQPAGDLSNPPGDRLPLLPVRPAVTFPVAEHHRPLAGTHFTVPRRVEGWVDLRCTGYWSLTSLNIAEMISVRHITTIPLFIAFACSSSKCWSILKIPSLWQSAINL